MVSIIMPAYNAEKTILESISSVFEQSYTDWELIVVEDCSRDKTLELVEEFIHKYEDDLKLDGQNELQNRKEKDARTVIPRQKKSEIRLLRNPENRGVAFSRNRGVEAARGEWIAFLDSDDLWAPDKLEKQIRYVKDHDMKEGLVFTGSTFITEHDKILDYVLHVPEKIERSELLKQNVISCSSVLVSRNLVRKYRFPENIKTIHEDFVVWLEILGEVAGPTDSENNTAKLKRSEKKTRVAYGIDEPLLTYRIAAGSKSGKKSKAALMNLNTYRFVGLGFVHSLYYMIHYSFRGALKWARIKGEK